MRSPFRVISTVIVFTSFVFATSSSFAAKGSKGAGIVVQPAFSYWSSSDDNNGDKLSTTRFDLQFGLGYKFDMGLYVGGTYKSASNIDKAEGTTTAEVKSAWTSYGPTVGFMKNNFFIFGTYHLSAELTEESGGTKVTSHGGSAFQFDLGYTFMITDNFGIGPQLTYYTAEYKKMKTDAGEVDYPSARKQSDIRPLLHLQFMF